MRDFLGYPRKTLIYQYRTSVRILGTFSKKVKKQFHVKPKEVIFLSSKKQNLVRRQLKLDQELDDRLKRIAHNLNTNVSQLVRESLKNLDEKKAELILFDDQQKQNEVQLIATRKVLMRLFSNATNNINQMSKRLNRNLFVSEDEFLQLVNSVNELKKEVSKIGNLKNN